MRFAARLEEPEEVVLVNTRLHVEVSRLLVHVGIADTSRYWFGCQSTYGLSVPVLLEWKDVRSLVMCDDIVICNFMMEEEYEGVVQC